MSVSYLTFSSLLLIKVKGVLSSKQRPAEWGKWIAKGSKGGHVHSSTPAIVDPLDLGWPSSSGGTQSNQLFAMEILFHPQQSMTLVTWRWVMYGLDCGKGA